MVRQINRFWNEQDGAITLDWVAISAGIVLLAVAVLPALDDNVSNVVQSIESELPRAETVSITASD